MPQFYDRLYTSALRLLTTYGQPVTLRKFSVGGGGYDPNSGTAAASAFANPIDSIRYGITTDAPGKRVGPQYGVTLEAGSLIQDTDKWVYMDANGPAPALQDHLIVDGLEYVIIDVQLTKPGTKALMYLLVLRA